MDRSVQKYDSVDIELKGHAGDLNPFLVGLKGIFRGPRGETIVVPGFFDGNGIWKIRFSPTEAGKWEYITYSPLEQLDGVAGTIDCTANSRPTAHGVLSVDTSNPHHFRFADGSRYFMLAYEVDWLWALGFGDTENRKTTEFLDSIVPFGFNCVIVNVYAYDTPWAKGKTSAKDYGPPPSCPWEGTNDNPDFDHLNLQYFDNFDRMMRLLAERGIIAHLFFKVYNKFVNWPERYSLQDDLFFSYVTARYQAFPNVIWDYSKETYYETDKDYVKNRMDLVRSLDGYRHLITVHDDTLFYANENHRRSLDFYTAQQHGDLFGAALLERERHTWPVFNSEFSYECGGPKETEVLPVTACHTAEQVIEKTYEVVMAGAYPAYYYTCTAWDIIDYSYQPPGYDYIKILSDFFTSISWWNLKPSPDLCSGHVTANRGQTLRCLADIGKEYVFYISPNTRGFFAVENSGAMKATWINTLTGERIEQATPLESHLTSPFRDAPALLHVRVPHAS